MAHGDLAQHGRHRDELLRRISRVLAGDPRVVAVWLSGSFGRGQADAWSDLDLHVAVADEQLPSFLAEREAVFRQCGQPVLVGPDEPSVVMTGARFNPVIYAGAIGVDWNIGPAGQAVRRGLTRVVFDRVGIPALPSPGVPREQSTLARQLAFFWSLALAAAKDCGRGHTSRAAREIDLLTYVAIELWYAAWRPDRPLPDPGRAFQGLDPELAARLSRLGQTIDPLGALQVVRGLCGEVERLQPTLAALGVELSPALVADVTRLIGLAEGAARQIMGWHGEA